MMLRRRMPRPVPPLTKMPSSSGPRCTILSHMRWIVLFSTLAPGRVSTIPAIPHMPLCPLNRQRRRAGMALLTGAASAFQTIIPVLAGVSLASVACSQDNFHHLARRGEMQDLPPLSRSLDKFSQKLPHRRSENRGFLCRIHAVAVQLNEQPVRTSAYSNPCLLPQP